MKRLLAMLALALSAAGVQAEGLDINLSEQALRGAYAGALEEVTDFSGIYEIGLLLGEEEQRDFRQGHLGLLITGDAGAREANVVAGLGGRVLLMDADAVSGGALALGGRVEARLPAFNRIGVMLYAYAAPKASAFGDLEGHLEYAIDLDYQVLRNASVYTGYRQLKVDVAGYGDATLDNGWHLGLRLNF